MQIMAEPPETTATDVPLALLIDLLAERPVAGRELAQPGWEEFARLAVERHRVAPLALEGATGAGFALPSDVRSQLEEAAREAGAEALRQKAETHRLLSAMAESGCRPAVLKGWPLAEALYGSAAMRHAKDLDLWVGPEEVETCIAALARLGYGLDPEHEARAPLLGRAAFLAEFNDLAFWHPARGVQVELHWRSQHFRFWPELGELPGAWEERPLDATGLTVRVPSARANLIYLAQHGQQHLWQRLKWLADYARLLTERAPEELAADLAAAQAVSAARPVVIAGHLAHRVLGAPLPPGWPESGPIEARAVGFFRRAIAAADPEPGSLRTRLGYYGAALVLAETVPQRVGVLRYGLWRRLRFPRVA